MADPHIQATNDDEAFAKLHMQWEAEEHEGWLAAMGLDEREAYERSIAFWGDEP
jgi:hypothetical protein